VRELNAAGLAATVDALGEAIASEQEARAVLEEYRRVLAAVREQRLRAGLSVKPTALGLELSPALCHELVAALAREASAQSAFVRIDMEDSSTTDRTLDLYESLRSEGHANVGVVLQAMLRRSLDDARRVARLGASVRVCKGIYREPRELVVGDAEAVRESFLAIAEAVLEGGGPVAFATHDRELAARAERIVERRTPGEAYHEFQLLLGVDPELERLLLERGHRVRIYVPFGARWYEYSLRRLQENPSIAGHVGRAAVARATARLRHPRKG
jgi:proline dehydrogenase